MSSLNRYLLFIIVALIVIGQFVPSQVESREDSHAVPTSTPTPTLIPTPTVIPVAYPSTISIPKMGVQAQVESVSVDFDGKMNMPEDYAKVAWYSLGFKPGEKGNSVIAGHLDTTTGAPALFFNLKDLEPGDELSVTAADGKVYTFVVTHKELYEYNNAPIDLIFGPTTDKNLNLMTCAGWWNQTTHNYSQRLVVFTRLKES